MSSPFFDIYIGDKAEFDKTTAEYEATKKLASDNAHIYGFPPELETFIDEQKEMLQSLPHVRQSWFLLSTGSSQFVSHGNL